METMNEFQRVIKNYLDKKAETDELFKEKYQNKDKNIENCCKYICTEVKKTNRCGFADDEIYSLAMHYYDEKDLEIDKNINCKVVINEENKNTFPKPQPQTYKPSKPKIKEEEPNLFSQLLEQQKKELTEKEEEPNLFNI